jgi:hypothetical protein
MYENGLTPIRPLCLLPSIHPLPTFRSLPDSTIGPRTIEITIQAGKTILIDREKTLDDAQRAGIVIVSQPS